MSRIGNKKIEIPSNVLITLENKILSVKGPYGNLFKNLLPNLIIELNSNTLKLLRTNEDKQTKSNHGLMRNLIYNMIEGVSNKFVKILILEGVGYKFQVHNTKLTLLIGYTHSVDFQIPSDVNILLESPTRLKISGIDKEKISLFASQIYNIKPPEPYKGKGIHYEGEIIFRKAGKTKK
jgi:large subunit ribosomal protein L6